MSDKQFLANLAQQEYDNGNIDIEQLMLIVSNL